MKLIFNVLLLLYFLPIFGQNFKLDSIQDSLDNFKKSKLSDSEKIFELERRLLKSTNKDVVMLTSMVLGDLYNRFEMNDNAFVLYRRALDIALKNGYFENAANYYAYMAYIRLKEKNYEESLFYYKKSYDLNIIYGNPEDILMSKGNIAVLQSYLGREKEAELTLDSLGDNDSLDSLVRSKAFINKGDIYFERFNKPDKALDLYKKGISLLSNSDGLDRNYKILLYQKITKLLLSQRNYEEAYVYNILTDSLLKLKPILKYQSSLSRNYSAIYEGKKNYEKALEYFKVYKKFADTLDQNNLKFKVNNVVTTSKINALQKEEEIASRKIKALEYEKTINGLKISILLLFLILFTVIIIWRWSVYRKKILNYKKEKIKLNDRININKDKVQNLSINIGNNEEFTSAFIGKLQEAVAKITDKHLKNEIHSIFREYKAFELSNKENKHIKNLLQKINDDFYINLSKAYPSLSEEEQRLCSLILLNLKNKEIASLLNLSVRSIENKRYRIRKKMQLESSEKLDEILQELMN